MKLIWKVVFKDSARTKTHVFDDVVEANEQVKRLTENGYTAAAIPTLQP